MDVGEHFQFRSDKERYSDSSHNSSSNSFWLTLAVIYGKLKEWVKKRERERARQKEFCCCFTQWTTHTLTHELFTPADYWLTKLNTSNHIHRHKRTLSLIIIRSKWFSPSLRRRCCCCSDIATNARRHRVNLQIKQSTGPTPIPTATTKTAAATHHQSWNIQRTNMWMS